MKKSVRDIVCCLAAVGTTLLAVWFYFHAVESKKTTVQTDLYSLIAPQYEAVLAINRPAIFTKLILSQTPVRQVVESHIPSLFLKIMEESPALSFFLFTIHSQGVVLYIKANSEQTHQIETSILEPLFNIYTPQKKEKDGITFTYYPDTENRFFGFYQHNGVWVASYSRKLLEEAATRQLKEKSTLADNIQEFRRVTDQNAPLNLLVSSNPLNLYVPLNDSIAWAIQNQSLAADIFIGENTLCCYGSLPYDSQRDTLYAPMADTLSLRLEKVFFGMPITHEIYQEGKRIYYLGCSPMQETSPSEEPR